MANLAEILNNVVSDSGVDVTSLQPLLTNPVTGTGASGQVVYWTGTTTQSGSNNLFWDAANGRLGIGTNSPTVTYTQRQSQGVFARYEITNANANQNAANFDVYTNVLATPDFFGRTAFKFEGGVNNASRQYQIYVADILNPKMVVNGAGNVIINSITDAGQRLQVNGDVLFKGSGNTSGTTALTVQNSDGTNMFIVRNDNRVVALNGLRVGGTLTVAGIFPEGGITNFEGLQIRSSNTQDFIGTDITISNGQGNGTATSGTRTLVNIARGFAPTSGTGVWNTLSISPTINQTGGANGVTRGILVNPTLTAAADWRSIEWSNNSGWGLYGAGSGNNYLAGRLGIGSLSLSDASLRIGRNITGTTIQYGVQSDGAVQSDVTTLAANFASASRTQNTTFTLNSLVGFYAIQASIGASSTVTNQFGFLAENSLTGATNNYAFYGNIASGTGRWNLYMNGTAANFLSGNTIIGGSAVDGGQKLQVTGTTQLTPAANSSALTSTGYSVTGSGTTAMVSMNGTVNTTGVVTPYSFDVTNTASASGSFLVQFRRNGSYLFAIGLNDGLIYANSYISASGALTLRARENAINGISLTGNSPSSHTSGTRNHINITDTYSPTSGTGISNITLISPTINQTGGANGITRGLYINPTLTAAADWRAIETTQGSLRMADTYLAGSGSLAGSLIDLTQTWNTTGAPTLIKANVTNTASGSAALLMDLQVGGSPKFRVDKNGRATASAEVYATALQTDDPSGGTKKPWKLGNAVSATVLFDQDAYVEVEIDGVPYKLALAILP